MVDDPACRTSRAPWRSRPPGRGRPGRARWRRRRCRAGRSRARPARSAARRPPRRAGGRPATRTPSKRIVAVAEPVRPILRSGGSATRPSLSAGTRKQEMPLLVLGGAGHDLVEVGVPAVGRPGLRAVEDVVVAVPPCRRPHRGGVGARVRLGEAVGAQQRAAEHLGEPALLLLLGAAGDEPEAGQGVHGDADARRSTRPRRSPPAPAGRPRRADRRRRTPRRTAARAPPARRASRTRRGGTSPRPRPRRCGGAAPWSRSHGRAGSARRTPRWA